MPSRKDMNLEKQIQIFDTLSGNSETTSRHRWGFYSLKTPRSPLGI